MARKESLPRRAVYWVEDTVYDLRHRSAKPTTPAAAAQPRSKNLFDAAVAEYLGTLLFILFGLMVVVHTARAGGPAAMLAVAVAFGVALTAMIIAIGPYTGANFNPAITFALWAHGKIDRRTAVAYWIAQILGGISAAVLVRILSINYTDASVSGYGITEPSNGVPTWVAGLSEFIGMAVFQFLIAAVVARKWHPVVTGVSIGMTLGVLVLVFGSVSGGGFNPARTLGPMIVTGDLGYALWYVIPQLAGAWLGQWYYQRRLRHVEQP